ncbi:hypothetical protein KRX11_10150 [Pasteurellaceae bacterium TAE3-ERU1]|nr:hypothetical protein [Pasteurellaceae bacterium TAE3-ERU1]
MPFSTIQKKPFTKKVILNKFIAKHQNRGNDYVELQDSILRSIGKGKGKGKGKDIHYQINEHIKVKCREFTSLDGKLIIFFSWYDDRIDVSITRENSSAELESTTINNADICHLFLSIEKEHIWAFCTLTGQGIQSKITRTLNNLLPTDPVEIVVDIDQDVASKITNEGIKHIAIESQVDMLALGFRKKNFMQKLFSKEQPHTEMPTPNGTLIIDSKNNIQIINAVEASPKVAMEYISEDEDEYNKNIYIVTKKNTKIDGEELKKTRIVYMSPFGRTKTVSWTDVKSVFKNIKN